jgi:hypothetical protein
MNNYNFILPQMRRRAKHNNASKRSKIVGPETPEETTMAETTTFVVDLGRWKEERRLRYAITESAN